MKRWQLVLIGLIGIYGIAVLRARPLPTHNWITDAETANRPLVIAHQGGDGLRPSNTLAAFAHAVELGVDVLEMDLHSTSDGVLVTIHDTTVDRTTDGTGLVNDYTFADLQTLDAGYNWPTLYEDSTYPYRGQGITIPALEDIFEQFPDQRYNIEIKQQEPSLIEPLCTMLRDYDLTQRTLVAAFSDDTVVEFRAACPEVATALSQKEVVPIVVLSTFGLGGTWNPSGTALQIPETRFNLTVLKRSVIRSAQRKGIHVHAWTINETTDIQRILEMDVDGIITDYPDRMLDVLDN